jgi:phosphoglycerate dehydrogenase-like enzyme
MTPSTKLRVVVATPLSEENCRLIEQREPRVDLIRDHSLNPSMRYPADFAGDPQFRRSDTQQRQFEAMVDSADALFGIPDLQPKALTRTVKANPRLRWVHTMAAGGGSQVKAAGLSYADLDRVAFTTSTGVHGGPLAEFAVFGVLAGAKDLPRLMAHQRERHWGDRWAMRQVSEMTVLVLGLGGIGSQVARKLSSLGAQVIGTSRHNNPVEHVDRVVRVEEVASVLPEVDAVVVTLPGTAATEGLLDEEFFLRIRPGSTLVSVGRGSVIDEDALLAALEDGRVSFAALDVFAQEPLPQTSPLWRHPSVLVSPHTAALNAAEERLIAQLFARNASRLLDGEPLLNRVDTVDFY